MYDLSLKPLSLKDESISGIASLWLGLQKEVSDLPFFLSWPWISTWLKSFDFPCYILEAKKNNKTVGLAILVEKTQWRFGFIPIKQLYLHKTGRQKHDQMWIEYNDFLLSDDNSKQIRSAMLAFLTKQKSLSWHELHCDMMKNEVVDELDLSFLDHRITMTDKGYSQSLKPKQDILASFSKNTRQQLKRSQKLLKEQGKLRVKVFEQSDVKEEKLKVIASLHQKQWRDSQWGSGFDNAIFSQFHQQLITNEYCELAVLCLNDEELAYSYNFCWQGEVSFYLSAVPKIQDNRVKIGLLLHSLAMEHYQEKGYSKYDFLAGEARYKNSLSDVSYQLTSVCLFQTSLISKFENMIRPLKMRLKNWMKKNSD